MCFLSLGGVVIGDGTQGCRVCVCVCLSVIGRTEPTIY